MQKLLKKHYQIKCNRPKTSINVCKIILCTTLGKVLLKNLCFPVIVFLERLGIYRIINYEQIRLAKKNWSQYAFIDRLIVDYSIIKTNDGLHLNIVSIISPHVQN